MTLFFLSVLHFLILNCCLVLVCSIHGVKGAEQVPEVQATSPVVLASSSSDSGTDFDGVSRRAVIVIVTVTVIVIVDVVCGGHRGRGRAQVEAEGRPRSVEQLLERRMIRRNHATGGRCLWDQNCASKPRVHPTGACAARHSCRRGSHRC